MCQCFKLIFKNCSKLNIILDTELILLLPFYSTCFLLLAVVEKSNLGLRFSVLSKFCILLNELFRWWVT